MPKDYPSIESLRQAFLYKDGKLFWLVRPVEHFTNADYASRSNKKLAGKEAGCKSEYIDKYGKIHKRWVVIKNSTDIKLFGQYTTMSGLTTKA
jgi:hypothetical protein